MWILLYYFSIKLEESSDSYVFYMNYLFLLAINLRINVYKFSCIVKV